MVFMASLRLENRPSDIQWSNSLTSSPGILTCTCVVAIARKQLRYQTYKTSDQPITRNNSVRFYDKQPSIYNRSAFTNYFRSRPIIGMFRLWWAGRDLNPRPSPCEGDVRSAQSSCLPGWTTGPTSGESEGDYISSFESGKFYGCF